MFRCTCGQNETGEFIVHPPAEFDPDGVGVLVTAAGEVTNRYGDGTIGVPAELAAAASEETEARCPVGGETVEWDSAAFRNRPRELPPR